MGAGRMRLDELVQPRDLGVDVQAPAAVLIEPAAKLGRVATHKPERVGVVGVAQQRSSQQRPGRALEVALVGLLERRIEAHADRLRSASSLA